MDNLFKYERVSGHKGYDRYYANFPAGDFFSYGEPTVEVNIINNTSDCSINMRHYKRGFYITIKTSDDYALYADWIDPLSEDNLEKVFWYFNELVVDGLDTAPNTLKDIEDLINIKCLYVNYS